MQELQTVYNVAGNVTVPGLEGWADASTKEGSRGDYIIGVTKLEEEGQGCNSIKGKWCKVTNENESNKEMRCMMEGASVKYKGDDSSGGEETRRRRKKWLKVGE